MLLPSPFPTCSYAFSVWFPLAVQLRKELGELLVELGLVGAALQLFEALELWDNLIVCYQLLDKRVQVRVHWKGVGVEVWMQVLRACWYVRHADRATVNWAEL